MAVSETITEQIFSETPSTSSGRKHSLPSTASHKKKITNRDAVSKRGLKSSGRGRPLERIPSDQRSEHFRVPVVTPFTALFGVRRNLNITSSPVECFREFIDDELIHLIVSETNSYANNIITSKSIAPQAQMQQWKDTTPNEILVFLALILLMGNIKKLHLNMYFSTDPLYNTPIFGSAMTRNRFF